MQKCISIQVLLLAFLQNYISFHTKDVFSSRLLTPPFHPLNANATFHPIHRAVNIHHHRKCTKCYLNGSQTSNTLTFHMRCQSLRPQPYHMHSLTMELTYTIAKACFNKTVVSNQKEKVEQQTEQNNFYSEIIDRFNAMPGKTVCAKKNKCLNKILGTTKKHTREDSKAAIQPTMCTHILFIINILHYSLRPTNCTKKNRTTHGKNANGERK